MTSTLHELWIYISSLPLFWLTVTLSVFQGCEYLFKWAKGALLLNPVITSVAILIGLLYLTGTDYQTYMSGAQFINTLLGPAIVALAIPLYRQVETTRRSLGAILASLTTGSVFAFASAVTIAWLLGGPPEILLSLAPKSVTVPIAMGISERIGGQPALTAVLVLLTGIVGNVFGGRVLDLFRVTDRTARGLAYGVAAHGNGTARALHEDPQSGAFSGLAMVLNGLITAILLPFTVQAVIALHVFGLRP